MKNKLTAILIAVSLVLSFTLPVGAADIKSNKEITVIDGHVFEVIYSESFDSRKNTRNIKIDVFSFDEEAARFLDEMLAPNANGELSEKGIEVFEKITPDEPVTRNPLCWIGAHLTATTQYTVTHHAQRPFYDPCHITTYVQNKCIFCDYVSGPPTYIGHVYIVPSCH